MDPKPLRSFARTVRLDAPIVWGNVEAQILAMPVPSEEAAAVQAPRSPGGAGVGIVPIVLFAAPAVIGLVLVAWATLIAAGAPDWFPIAAGGVFVVAGAAMLAPALTVIAGRRGAGHLPAVVVAAVVTLVSLVLLLVDGPASMTWLPWLVGVVALAGIGSIVRLARTTPAARTGRIDASALSSEDRWRWNARAFVLEEILRRDDVDERSVDQAAMTEMPLGAWRSLDAGTHR